MSAYYRTSAADAVLRSVAERIANWHPRYLLDAELELWTDPDHPDDPPMQPTAPASFPRRIVAENGWDTITMRRTTGRRLAKVIRRVNRVPRQTSPLF